MHWNVNEKKVSSLSSRRVHRVDEGGRPTRGSSGCPPERLTDIDLGKHTNVIAKSVEFSNVYLDDAKLV